MVPLSGEQVIRQMRQRSDTALLAFSLGKDAVQAGFRKRAKAENKRFVDATDSEYWFAVCFKTREQKETFLRAMKWLECGDKYLPGELVAKVQGIDLPGGAAALRSLPRIDKDYAGLAIE